MRFIVDAFDQILHRCMWNQLNLRKVKPLIGKGLKLLVNKYTVPFAVLFLKRQRYEISEAASGMVDCAGSIRSKASKVIVLLSAAASVIRLLPNSRAIFARVSSRKKNQT